MFLLCGHGTAATADKTAKRQARAKIILPEKAMFRILLKRDTSALKVIS